MKATIFLVLLIVGLAMARKRQQGKFGGPLGKWQGRRRGPFQCLVSKCEVLIKACSSENKGRRSRWGKKKQENVEVCLLMGGEYITFQGSMCAMKQAQACNGTKIVHGGKCADCSPGNLCKKSLMAMNRTVCTESGAKYNTPCDYSIARCEAAKNGEDLPLKTSCVSKCDRITSYCAKQGGEEPKVDLGRKRRHHGNRGRHGNKGRHGKRGRHGNKPGGGEGKWEKKKKRPVQNICVRSADGVDTTEVKSKCGSYKEMACNNAQFLHSGACGNCTEANVCPYKVKLESMIEMKKQQNANGRGRWKQYKDCAVKKMQYRLDMKIKCHCNFNVAKCKAAANGEEIPDKASFQGCQKKENGEEDDDSKLPPPEMEQLNDYDF